MNGYLNTLSIESLSDAAICIIPGIGSTNRYYSSTKIFQLNYNKCQDMNERYEYE